MDMCNSCLWRQAWLLECGDGSQVVCQCLDEGELNDGSNLGDFEKMVISKWIPGCEYKINPVKLFSIEKIIPNCSYCKWQQAWILEHGYDLQIVCDCAEDEEAYLGECQRSLVEKWFYNLNDDGVNVESKNEPLLMEESLPLIDLWISILNWFLQSAIFVPISPVIKGRSSETNG